MGSLRAPFDSPCYGVCAGSWSCHACSCLPLAAQPAALCPGSHGSHLSALQHTRPRPCSPSPDFSPSSTWAPVFPPPHVWPPRPGAGGKSLPKRPGSLAPPAALPPLCWALGATMGLMSNWARLGLGRGSGKVWEDINGSLCAPLRPSARPGWLCDLALWEAAFQTLGSRGPGPREVES